MLRHSLLVLRHTIFTRTLGHKVAVSVVASTVLQTSSCVILLVVVDLLRRMDDPTRAERELNR